MHALDGVRPGVIIILIVIIAIIIIIRRPALGRCPAHGSPQRQQRPLPTSQSHLNQRPRAGEGHEEGGEQGEEYAEEDEM